MRRLFKLLIVFAVIYMNGCSSDKSPPPYKPGGIVISYATDDDLNTYDDSSHSVMLAVYQLNNINGFHQLAKDLTGIQKLLGLTKFDSSVLGVDSIFVNAAESGTIKLDRLQDTEWIGVVAGYYNLTAGQVTKEFQIPANSSKILKINLVLSPDSLQEVPAK